MRKDWAVCDFGEIINFKNGFAFKSSDYISNGIPIIRIGDINQNKISIEDSKNVKESSDLDEYLIKKGDILIAMSGATTGKFGMYNLDSKAYLNQRVGNIFPISSDLVYKPYLFFLLHFLKRQIEKDAYGGAQPNISSKKIEEMKVPFIPLPEQRAIVKKIEALFSSLDAGIADLKKAQDQLKIYRQAVLKKAFEGISEVKKVSDIASVETGATPKRGNKLYWENGTIPWITSGALNEEFVNNFNELITLTAIKETNCKVISKGALLIAMYGEGKTRGKCSELKIDAATNQAVAAIVVKDEFTYCKPFVKWFFIKNYNDIRLLSSGGVQPNLNLSIIKNTVIPYPSKEEQAQIVKEIEARLSVCDAIEQQIKDSLTQAEALRQSILKKAFEGKLLTEEEITSCKQEPDYEPASVLLDKIKAEKEANKPAKKKTTKKKTTE
ncbi:restriction endonuclease subunit S [Empedobacter falsenii]|uniref:Restriction endonuclease subunit S n=1 Tax=Empedobacter falsenii TaxID=343874 RepID=A0ABY8VAD7_9FLAO|nr:restriction endonuclease subunit S [Empedobacter falsenii]WIH96505.1 restriction endonuclease subunit S [Empedobacter falsenii]